MMKLEKSQYFFFLINDTYTKIIENIQVEIVCFTKYFNAYKI